MCVLSFSDSMVIVVLQTFVYKRMTNKLSKMQNRHT